MVSMKPGSGTLGLDPDFDDNSGSPEQVERRRERGLLKGVGTRYRGPPPGTHGPWRWGQLVKGSALEEVSEQQACIAMCSGCAMLGFSS